MSNQPDTSAPSRFSIWRDCFVTSLGLGLTSFGGPIAHLGYFERTYVTRKGWLDAARYAQIVSLCQVLPGPASSQANFLIGWMRGGGIGALLSFIGFTAPSAALMVLAALFLDKLGSVQIFVHAMFLVAAVIVGQAVWSMAGKLWRGRGWVVGVLATIPCILFGGIYVQLAVIVLGGIAGALFFKKTDADAPSAPLPEFVSLGVALRCAGAFLALLALLPLIVAISPAPDIYSIADVFYRSGALVFGGGHVVLPLLYDALPAVQEQMLFLYGAAQALPGPLFSIAAALGVLLLPSAPLAGAAIASFFVFLPGLLIATSGAYFWQRVFAHRGMQAALSGINAAVVGILAGAFVNPVVLKAVTSPYDLAFVIIALAAAIYMRAPAYAVIALCVVYAAAAGALT